MPAVFSYFKFIARFSGSRSINLVQEPFYLPALPQQILQLPP
jgi:hypothetical protein